MRRFVVVALFLILPLAVVWAVNSALPFRVGLPVKGKVIDRETKKPIRDAAVRLETIAACPKLHGSNYHQFPPQEVKTSEDGSFKIDWNPGLAPCPFPSWRDVLTIVAVGYWPEYGEDDSSVQSVFKGVRYGSWKLNPIRYQMEFESYKWAEGERPGDKISKPEQEQVVFKDTFAKAKYAATRPLSEPGIFVSEPGAAFSKISVVYGGIYPDFVARYITVAHGKNETAFHAWSDRGEKIPLRLMAPQGLDIIDDRRRFPILVQGDDYYLQRRGLATLDDLSAQQWFSAPSQNGKPRKAIRIGIYMVAVEDDGKKISTYDFDPRKPSHSASDIVPKRLLPLDQILPAAEPPVECMTEISGSQTWIAFIAFVGGQRALFIASIAEGAPDILRAQKIDIEPGLLTSEVTACAGGESGQMYIALKDGGIIKIQIETTRGLDWKYIARLKARRLLDGKDGRLNFVSMAIGQVWWVESSYYRGEALYAVANDENVYRFNADLVPDRRVQVQK
ncbi:MAG TPA: hypothetical protein VGH16_23910 [Candidatus Binatia bacterium]|jgi:hypothetical protein